MTHPPTLTQPDPPGRGYTCVGVRLLSEWIEAQPGGVSLADARIAEACGISRPAVSKWRLSSKRPAPCHWATISRLTGIDLAAWERWELLGQEESAPGSERRSVAELPELRGTPAERARTLETWLEGRARSGQGLTLDLDRSVRALLSSIQAQVRAKPIPDLHEHPDWDIFVTLVLGALARHPGAAKAVIDAIRATSTAEVEAA